MFSRKQCKRSEEASGLRNGIAIFWKIYLATNGKNQFRQSVKKVLVREMIHEENNSSLGFICSFSNGYFFYQFKQMFVPVWQGKLTYAEHQLGPVYFTKSYYLN